MIFVSGKNAQASSSKCFGMLASCNFGQFSNANSSITSTESEINTWLDLNNK